MSRSLRVFTGAMNEEPPEPNHWPEYGVDVIQLELTVNGMRVGVSLERGIRLLLKLGLPANVKSLASTEDSKLMYPGYVLPTLGVKMRVALSTRNRSYKVLAEYNQGRCGVSWVVYAPPPAAPVGTMSPLAKIVT